MPRLLLIPDVHNAIAWVQAVLADFEGETDRTVFLGDYFDSSGDDARDAEATALWLRGSLKSSRRVHLFGNHDLSYAAPGEGTACSGWSAEKEAAIAGIMRPRTGPDAWESLKGFYLEGGWLFTHAGLRGDLFDPPDFKPSRQTLETRFALALRRVRGGSVDPLFGAGACRMGDFSFGGATWLDFTEAWECRHRLVTYHQVVGHSAMPGPQSIVGGSAGFSLLSLGQAGRVEAGAVERSVTCLDARAKAFAVVDTAESRLTVFHGDDGMALGELRRTEVAFFQ